MKKIFSFSLLLILGLVASQILPGMLGESYPAFRAGATTFLYVCLSFIMINVGREFEIIIAKFICTDCKIQMCIFS